MDSILQKEIARTRIESIEQVKAKRDEKVMSEEVKLSLSYGKSYLSSAKSTFNNTARRFDNDLLYNIIAISFEQFMVGLLAYHDWIASSHLPMMLYREALSFEPELGDGIKETALLIGSFEGICSIEDFGYKTPCDEAIKRMLDGLDELKKFIAARVSETNS